MTSPTAEALREVLDHAIHIAPQLKQDAAWMHEAAYGLTRRDRDRPTLIHDPGDTPDHVPGHTFDLGITDDKALATWHEIAAIIPEAHRLAGVAVACFNGRRPPVGTRRPARYDEFDTWVDATTRRLRWLTERDWKGVGDDTRLKAHAAASELIRAAVVVEKVLRPNGGVKELPADRRCSNCQGPAAEGRRECWKCINYRMRNHGRVRPVPKHAGVFAARDRRRERGEDFGRSVLPRASGRREAS